MTPATPAPGFPVVGMVGGGQLARMSAPAAARLGVGLRLLAERGDDSAAQVVVDTVLGAPDDPAALAELARGCAVVTFDHEHVPQAQLATLAAAGVVLRPGATALAHAQDKGLMRRRLAGLGVPVPGWAPLARLEDLPAVGDALGWPLVVKTTRGGYDGRGVTVVGDAADTAVVAGWLASGAELLAEAYVDFGRELAVQVARSPSGQAAVYPVVQTVQVDGICREVYAPAPDLDEEVALAAQGLALQVSAALDCVGLLTVEMFQTEDGVVVNELAMRPHNSGHWSLEGAVTDQFEQHLRAVLDLPLGSPRTTAPATVMVNVLGGDDPALYPALLHVLARDPEVHVHLYGKTVRPGRKVGHVTVVGDDHADLVARARHAADFLAGDIDE